MKQSNRYVEKLAKEYEKYWKAKELEEKNPQQVFFEKVICYQARYAARRGKKETLLDRGGIKDAIFIKENLDILTSICSKHGLKLYKDNRSISYYWITGWAK